jgi:CxxC motif-containing protein
VEVRKMICVSCPVGCTLSVTLEGAEVVKVEGNQCPRGETYAVAEVRNPVRVFTSTVRVEGGALPVCPVRSRRPIPLDKVFDVARELARVKLVAPVEIGQVIIADVCGTGVDIVASRSLKRKES